LSAAQNQFHKVLGSLNPVIIDLGMGGISNLDLSNIQQQIEVIEKTRE